METSYQKLLQDLELTVRSLDSESLSLDDLERSVQSAYETIDQLKQRLASIEAKVTRIIQIREGTGESANAAEPV